MEERYAVIELTEQVTLKRYDKMKQLLGSYFLALNADLSINTELWRS